MAPRVFISYARKDGEDFATKLRERLEREQPEITLWQDRERMEGGVGWWKQITDAIDQVTFMVLVVTPASLESNVVQKEWRYAREDGVCVYPINAAPDKQLAFDKMPKWMSTAHFYDLDKEWETFTNYLKSPCHAVRTPFMAPDLPPQNVDRSRLLGQVLDVVLDASHSNPVATTLAVYGSGGFGKTTLAAQLCHNDEVMTAFVDGVLWATLGEKPNVLGELTKLYAALTGERPEFVNEDDAAIALGLRLQDKHCLIVVDDVWSSTALAPFLRASAGGTRLITTRQFDIALNATKTANERVSVDEMTSDEAVALLAQYLDGQSADQSALQSLAHRVGEWPILLELAGGALRQRLARGDTVDGALKYIDRALDREGVVAFDRRNSDERGDAVSRTVAVSLDLLAEDEKAAYAALSIFPEDAAVPLGAIEIVLQVEDFEAERLLETFDRLSLVKLDLKTGTVRLHDVMRAYLLARQKDAPSLHARLAKAWATPDRLPDPYAWRYVVYHMAEALQGAQPEERHAATKVLVDLVTNPDFRAGHMRYVTDMTSLRRDVDRALAAAQADEHPEAPLLVTRAALARAALVELEPQQLFDLARDGKLDQAEALLTVFEPEPHWQQAAVLMLAWTAAEGGHEASARALLTRLAAQRAVYDHLAPALVELAQSAIDHRPAKIASTLPPAPDEFTVTHIMQRLGGTGLTPIEPLLVSGLEQIGDDAPVFLAERDGPLLAAFANANPRTNATYLEQYIAAHASNPYRYYRDRSLWSLIPNIVQVSDESLAFDLLRRVTAGALAQTRIDFRSALVMALLGARTRSGDDTARADLEAQRDRTVEETAHLAPKAGEGDPWAHVLRRLIALAEVHASALDRKPDANALLDQAQQVHYSCTFAGFRAPACLTLAEALRACGRNDAAELAQALDHALDAAHNIQDADFCAVMTSRVNAMRERWWPSPPITLDLSPLIERFVASPMAPEFAPVHRVGDTYARRAQVATRLPLPPAMLKARTLKEIAQLYPSMRGAPEQQLVELNPQLNLAGIQNPLDQPLTDGALVNVIDDDFRPLLAARLSAEVLARDDLTSESKRRLIGRLVSIASGDLTPLDAVLARLLIVAPVQDRAALQPLWQAAEDIASKTLTSTAMHRAMQTFTSVMP